MEIYNELLEKIQKFIQLAVNHMPIEDKELFMAKADIKEFELEGFLKYKLNISEENRRSYGDMVEKIDHEVEDAFRETFRKAFPEYEVYK